MTESEIWDRLREGNSDAPKDSRAWLSGRHGALHKKADPTI